MKNYSEKIIAKCGNNERTNGKYGMNENGMDSHKYNDIFIFFSTTRQILLSAIN